VARIFLLMILLQVASLSNGQDLEVLITNVNDEPGTLLVGLFDSKKTFLKKPVRGEKVIARAGTVKALFKNVPAGEYAISVFHDVNGNDKLDSNFIGIPKEGVGASNDAMGSFGPPSYDKAKFKIPRKEVVRVKMKYL
jgi:uncharacterized protein (DUF2141 family)